jgi:hypothetical protein
MIENIAIDDGELILVHMVQRAPNDDIAPKTWILQWIWLFYPHQISRRIVLVSTHGEPFKSQQVFGWKYFEVGYPPPHFRFPASIMLEARHWRRKNGIQW